MAARAYVLITTEVGKAAEVAERLRQLQGVTTADIITGPYDIVAVVEGPENSSIGRLVMNELHGLHEIRSTITLIAVG